MKIDLDSKLKQILCEDGVKKVFKKYKIRCSSCRGISEDLVRNVIFNYGLDKDIFLDELNKAIK